MKIKYSERAEIIINSLKEFDRADFEAWYTAILTVGDRTIMEYITYKDKEKNNGNNKC